MRLLFCSWSHILTQTKKKKTSLESLWGSELGIVLQKFSISDTNYTEQYVGQKRQRETPGGPEEIIPPPLILRSAARFSGRAVQKVWISSHLDVWDQNDDDRGGIMGLNLRVLLKMPFAR